MALAIFIGDYDGAFISAQHFIQFLQRFTSWPRMDRPLPYPQSILVHQHSQMAVARLIDEYRNRITLNGQPRTHQKKIP